MNAGELGSFLKSRRARVRPADVGLPEGPRRRVAGLRRDEVARLADMSVDYYIELEQGRGQSPSPQILAALARALRLGADESAHLMHLAGHQVPLGADPMQMQRALRELMERLEDTPVMVITDLHQTLMQNRMLQTLIGPFATGPGLQANFAYRWFTDPEVRSVFVPEEHCTQSRALVSDLRAAVARRGSDRTSTELIARLRSSAEFAELWDTHDVAVPRAERKRVVHPTLGIIEVGFNSFYTADAAQRLLWLTPSDPGIADSLRELNPDVVWRGLRKETAVTPDVTPDQSQDPAHR